MSVPNPAPSLAAAMEVLRTACENYKTSRWNLEGAIESALSAYDAQSPSNLADMEDQAALDALKKSTGYTLGEKKKRGYYLMLYWPATVEGRYQAHNVVTVADRPRKEQS